MDPLRMLYDGPSLLRRRMEEKPRPAYIERHDALGMAIEIIARNELRVWYEPDWGMARYLARRFPHCLVFSIPEESNTVNMHRTPGWRARRHNNAFL